MKDELTVSAVATNTFGSFNSAFSVLANPFFLFCCQNGKGYFRV